MNAWLRVERRRVGLPPARSRVVESRLWIPAGDGVRLATRLLRPADASVRRGAVLVRSERPIGSGSPLEKLARWLAGDGCSVVFQSCRGRDASEGAFRPFADELADGGAALRWVVEQAEIEGPIVLLGLGYSAYTAWAAAAAEPARVAAIATGFGARDPYAWLFPGGVLQLEAALALAARLDGREGVEPGVLDLARAARHRPLGECDRVALRELSAFRAWQLHPERDAWWEERTPALADVPRALVVGGWYDCAFAASYADYEALSERAASRSGVPPSLLLGPWGAVPLPREHRRRDTDPLAVVAKALSGFVAHAVGALAPRDGGTRVFVRGTGWREARPWPPVRSAWRTLYLRGGGCANALDGDGRLDPEPPGQERADTFVADPADPVPSQGGAAWRGVSGPVDQRPVESRGDVLCYTGEPLSEALELAGRVKLSLHADAEAEGFDMSAKLVAVERDGAARWLAEGIVRATRDGVGVPLVIELGAVGARLSSGTRLRLEVAGSSLPRFARREVGDGGAREAPDLRTVHHDAARPSALHFETAGDAGPAESAGASGDSE